MGALVGAVCLAGCGRIAFSPTSDAGGDGITPDTPPATARTWVRRTPATSPPPLNGITLVPYRGALVFYGSEDVPDTPQSIMWSYANGTWTQLCSPCTPGPHESHAIAHDPVRDVLVMVGGVIDVTQNVTNAVWEFDGTTWSNPTFASPPPALKYSTLVWYPPLQRLLLVGGESQSNVSSTTTYAYDGTSWDIVATGAPPGHSRSINAVWDPIEQRIVLFEGQNNAIRDNVWTWNGATWTQLCTACTGDERSVVSMIRDPGLGVLLVGGYLQPGEIAGTWQLQGTSFTRISTDPSARDSTGLGYDASRDTIVMFGGNGSGCGGDHCDETWEFVPAN